MQQTRDLSTPDPGELARGSRPTRSPSRADRSGPLPQFAFPKGDAADRDDARDAIDPDKTLETLPAWGRARAPSASSEIEAVDILEEVPVARRRPVWPAVPPAHEVRITDILHGNVATAPLPRASLASPPAPPASVRVLAAVADIAHVPRADSSIRIDWEDPAAPRRRRARALVATTLVALVGLLGVALARRGESHASAAQARSALVLPSAPASGSAASRSVPGPPETASAATAAHGDVPMVSVESLPRPVTGTVIGSPGHRLFIDGVVARGFSTTVRCGPHAVRVGSAGKVRSVDVPCGAEVYVR